MRTSLELSRISTLADVLRQTRGDTEWDDDERRAVTDALALLEAVQAHVDERHIPYVDHGMWCATCNLYRGKS